MYLTQQPTKRIRFDNMDALNQKYPPTFHCIPIVSLTFSKIFYVEGPLDLPRLVSWELLHKAPQNPPAERVHLASEKTSPGSSKTMVKIDENSTQICDASLNVGRFNWKEWEFQQQKWRSWWREVSQLLALNIFKPTLWVTLFMTDGWSNFLYQ